ncbi:uncharacterized protein BDR25DRAFT_296958 [Lindgomyces ingoldianus]|uniref:Uncharacterized protein n=1 Tax=Lindgomyces ingoldianus TaxID=673940 RepID=A0ACB6QD70_9PLEO|nr:uncharacterized protein BDR25DRAFT_296958 [Lindgomyces ingoldianus]KAF2464322.1 hypothetical protein BDR25DRAFT_296958 [Lindgomyces ingoldianus]
MPFPRRSARSISSQRLRSHRTSLSTSHGTHTPTEASCRISPSRVEDGIELVPIERQNSASAKQIAPGQEEKEVVPLSRLDLEISRKPLPSLPQSRWNRMSVKHRILTILCIQFCMVLTIGLSLRAPRSKSASSPAKQTVSPVAPTPTPIQLDTPIKHGAFLIPFGNVQQQSSACVAQSNESSAWTCKPRRAVRLSLLPSESMNVTLVYIESLNSSASLGYGIQDPNFPVMPLSTVIDPQYPNHGGAYYFKSRYDRVTLLKEEQIGAIHNNSFSLSQDEVTDIQPGSTLWQCFFNSTSVEGYLYVLQNATSTNQTLPCENPHNSTNTVMVSFLPYVMKITEEQLPGKTQAAYCNKVRYLGNRSLVTQFDGQGRPISMNLTMLGSQLQGVEGSQKRQTSLQDFCQCQWLYQ